MGGEMNAKKIADAVRELLAAQEVRND